jgi:uncharacterized protein GlcG (DUF336 family)
MKLKSVLTTAILGTALAAPGISSAQAPNLDAVPDKMPFDIPYGTPISLERADAVVHAALGEAAKRGWKMNCAIYDSGANLVEFKRMDGAQLASIAIAEHKARVAVKARRETKAIEDGVQKAGLIYLTTLDDFVASRGGIPLVEGGKIIGSIGCSGGTGSQDEVVAKAGAATVNK